MGAARQFNSRFVKWRPIVAKYQQADSRRSWGQVANTLIPYLALFFLMIFSLEISYWLTLALAIPAAGFYVRTFIIFHDCGHGSFFSSRRANTWLGFFTGFLTFTPYYHWRHSHARHHASAGDLDRRGSGDIWTLTVQEYLDSSPWRRFTYRVYRHPFSMFLFGPFIIFLIGHRFAGRQAKSRERYSVYITNLVLLAILAVAHFTIGLKAYALVQLPILFLGASVGIWLFYVQHQFEGVYWERHERWDYIIAALYGSSYYKLPRLLQWFTGNIGFHHIHHLSPRIPNYFLEKCHQEVAYDPPLQSLTLRSSLRSLRLRLWDEERRRLVGFRGLELAPPADGV
jgi:omega-6 fatty acid desaturase (delta-12 desaturase)